MTSAPSASLTDDGALDDRAGAEDRRRAAGDDRGVDERPARAGVGHRERGAAQLVRGDLVARGCAPRGRRSCARCPARLRSPASRMTGTTSPRSVSTAMPTFSCAVVRDLVALEHALIFGYALSASTAASAKNGRNVRLTPSRALKSSLARGAQAGDPGDVDLDHRGELRLRVQRLDHALGDDLAQPAAFSVVPRSGETVGRRPPSAGAAAGAAAGRRGAARRPWRPPPPSAAASRTSSLRMRPPTPVPVRVATSTPFSAASLRTSGVR